MLSIAIMILPVPDGPIGKLLSSRRPRSRLNLLFSKLCVRRQVVSSTWILLPLPNVPAPPCRFQIQIIYLVSKIVKKMMAFLVSVKLLVNLQVALVTRMLACWFLFRILVCLWFVRRMVLSQFPSASRFFNPWAFNCVFILCPMCQMESISYTMKTTCTSLPWSYGKAVSQRLMMQLLFRSPCLPWPSCSAMPTSLSTSAALPSPCQTPKRMSLVVLGCCPRMYTRLMFSLVIVATALSPQGMIFQHWCIVWVGSVPLLWEPCVGYECDTFGPNFFVENGKKINTAGPDDLGDVLFINMRKPASLWKYHTALEFRASVPAQANRKATLSPWPWGCHYVLACFEWAFHLEFAQGDCSRRRAFCDVLAGLLHSSPQDYLSPIGIAKVKGTWKNSNKHTKVHVKCGSTTQHQGRPWNNGKSKPYVHGWFILVNPKDLRVLGATSMEKTENNPVVRKSLLKILLKYKNLDGFVMDRVWGVAPSVKTDQAFKQIKFWAVDHVHALKHKRLANTILCTFCRRRTMMTRLHRTVPGAITEK